MSAPSRPGGFPTGVKRHRYANRSKAAYAGVSHTAGASAVSTGAERERVAPSRGARIDASRTWTRHGGCAGGGPPAMPPSRTWARSAGVTASRSEASSVSTWVPTVNEVVPSSGLPATGSGSWAGSGFVRRLEYQKKNRGGCPAELTWADTDTGSTAGMPAAGGVGTPVTQVSSAGRTMSTVTRAMADLLAARGEGHGGTEREDDRLVPDHVDRDVLDADDGVDRAGQHGSRPGGALDDQPLCDQRAVTSGGVHRDGLQEARQHPQGGVRVLGSRRWRRNRNHGRRALARIGRGDLDEYLRTAREHLAPVGHQLDPSGEVQRAGELQVRHHAPVPVISLPEI